MNQSLLHGIVTFIELMALSTLLGTALSLFWTTNLKSAEEPSPPFVDRLRRLLTVCLIVLVISSIGNLIQRTMEMSGMGLAGALPFLSTVLLKTHYGMIGLVRASGLGLALVLLFFGRRHIHSRSFCVLMFCAAAAIAFSRSATSHAADLGDLSIQELSDWLHLLAASSWAGVLLAIAGAIPPTSTVDDTDLQLNIAGIAGRFYTFFGPAYAVLMATGLYNTLIEVGSIEALLTTAYGLILSAKLAIFTVLTVRYIAPPQPGRDTAAFAEKFLRRTRVEALLVLVILFCVALFTHEIPARHAAHMMMDHEQAVDPSHPVQPGHSMEHGHSM